MTTLTEQIKAALEKQRDEILEYHGCITGDCPHDEGQQCYRELVKHTSDIRTEIILKLVAKMEAIGFHEGAPVLDISRNKAVEGFRNNVHVAKTAIADLKKELGIL